MTTINEIRLFEMLLHDELTKETPSAERLRAYIQGLCELVDLDQLSSNAQVPKPHVPKSI